MAGFFEKWATLLVRRGSIWIFLISLTFYLVMSYGFIVAEDKSEENGLEGWAPEVSP